MWFSGSIPHAGDSSGTGNEGGAQVAHRRRDSALAGRRDRAARGLITLARLVVPTVVFPVWQNSQADRERVWTTASAKNGSYVIVSRRLAANWLTARTLASVGAEPHLTPFRHMAAGDGYELLAGPAAEPDLALIAGLQSFARGRTPLPISAALLNDHTRVVDSRGLRTRRTGALVGCQSNERDIGRPSAALPLIYVGHRGRIVAQREAAGASLEPGEPAVNDGAWHHVALVRQAQEQSALCRRHAGADDSRRGRWRHAGSLPGGHRLPTRWPDASDGWMTFTGKLIGLRVAPRAWDTAPIANEWRTTRP